MATRTNLVTGGAGFIGQHVVGLLLARGERVRVLDIATGVVSSDVEWIRGSICDAGTVRQALKGIDRLFHLAANPNLWDRDKRVYERVNHQGTRTVLEEASRVDLERIVYTSTESILAGGDRKTREGGKDHVNVSNSLGLSDMKGPYCRSKYLAEQAALQAANRGQPVVVVTPTLPIGPGDYRQTPPTKMLLGFLNEKVPAYMECGLNLVDVRDVAMGHILAAEYGRNGERYILGGENVFLSELLLVMEELTGIRRPRIRIPYWAALGAATISELISDYITRRPPLAPLTGVRLAARPLFLDNSVAVRELGFAPMPLRTALRDAIEWFEDAGYLQRAAGRP